MDLNLYILPDMHIGNAATSFHAVDNAVRIVADDPIGYCGQPGDALEAIHLGDKRFDLDVHAGAFSTYSAQKKEYIRRIEPVASKMLFQLFGNHEWKLKHFIEKDDIGQAINDAGGNVISGGFSIVARLTPYCKIFVIHGSRTVNSQAGERKQREMNDALRVKRLMRNIRSDCHAMIMAHIHKVRILAPSEDMHIVGNGERDRDYFVTNFIGDHGIIHQDSRWYASTGACLKTYDDEHTTYGEIAMYEPTEMAMICLEVRDGRLQYIRKVPLRKE